MQKLSYRNILFSLTSSGLIFFLSAFISNSAYCAGKDTKVNSIDLSTSDYTPPSAYTEEEDDKDKEAEESDGPKEKKSELKPFKNKKIKPPTVKRKSTESLLNKNVEILQVTGEVTYAGKKIGKSDEIIFGEILETKKGSAILKIPEYGLLLHVRSKSKIKLFQKSHQIDILRGSTFIEKNKGRSFIVQSKNASIQVMNTKMLAFFKPILTETEVIVFEGKVQIDSQTDRTDKSLVEKGQWAGIGGRYGNTIGNVLNMPKKFIEKYEKALLK